MGRWGGVALVQLHFEQPAGLGARRPRFAHQFKLTKLVVARGPNGAALQAAAVQTRSAAATPRSSGRREGEDHAVFGHPHAGPPFHFQHDEPFVGAAGRAAAAAGRVRGAVNTQVTEFEGGDLLGVARVVVALAERPSPLDGCAVFGRKEKERREERNVILWQY